MTRVAFLPGDGIGPEVLPAARRVLDAAGFQAEWVELPVGWEEWRRHGDALPEPTRAALAKTQAALMGPITSKNDLDAERELPKRLQGTGRTYQSPILRIRRDHELHLNVRPIQSYADPRETPARAVDMVVFRENSEDLYQGVETHPTPPEVLEALARAGVPRERLPQPGADTALTARVITRSRTRHLMDAAFDHAARTGRRKVSLLEKPNVLRKTGALVVDEFRKAAARHTKVEVEELQIDAACALAVRDPARFDVVVTTNLFGDIFTDLAAELAGGLGLAPSANVGARFALFQPVHGSAPDIAGRGLANPTAAILSGALLAEHVGQADVARRIRSALEATLAEPARRTRDLGGTASTDRAANAVVEALGRGAADRIKVSGR